MPVIPLLAAKGFNRHTFLCGQSGSGKTYGLGVLLERLLLHTTIQMVILDPNSDDVGLGDLLPVEESAAQDLILLRMNSRVDIDHLARVFGFVPPSLLGQAAAFRLGEVWWRDGSAHTPLRYQGARRVTREGGADVPASWASRGG